MPMHCSRCKGTGYVAVDCPFCRDTDSFEHEDLTRTECLVCEGSGIMEDVCPECQGKGLSTSSQRIAS